jgi:hypothetical protein
VSRGLAPFSFPRRWRLTPFLSVVFLAACAPVTDLGYDAKADPFAQLEAAMSRARAENKRILVVAGGDWCGPCHDLHEFIEDDAQTRALLDSAFVQVHVYLGEDNFNEQFFEALPPTDYVPYYWVLAPDGTVLGEQSPADLEFEDSEDYDPARFAAFVARFRT